MDAVTVSAHCVLLHQTHCLSHPTLSPCPSCCTTQQTQSNEELVTIVRNFAKNYCKFEEAKNSETVSAEQSRQWHSLSVERPEAASEWLFC